jgi:lipoprotein-releasing system ATP-binding protein
MTPTLSASGLVRRFVGGDGRRFTVLDGAQIVVEPGEFVAIVGASGSGKSTLLHLLGGLDRADQGEVALEGTFYRDLSNEGLDRLRSKRIGFVFQFHHLLRDFTAVENVMMPLLIAGIDNDVARAESLALLSRVGMRHRADSRALLLSGGEQQRVALARALVGGPAALLADEPTGNLDPPTASGLHDLLGELAQGGSAAVIVVTHNMDLARRADRILTLENGRLRPVGQEANEP